MDSGSPKTHSENPDNSDCKGKKRRRSTGHKNSANKRCNSISDVTTDDTYKTKEGTAHMDTTNKMTDTQEETSNTTSIMLAEIMKMEERLAAKITSSKDQGLSDMEERLNNNIRSTIDSSIKDALKVMQNSLNTTVEKNPIVHSHSIELKNLRDENLRLNRKVQQLTSEQGRMKKQLTKMEMMALEHSLIIRGIPEEFKETEQMICDKIHHVLTKIMQGDTEDQKLSNAKQISIKSSHRLGRFSRQRTCPISMELHHKQDIEFILENRFALGQGIYVDREYPTDIERKRKILLPVLRAAKRSSEFKKYSRLEDDKIILKGRAYSVNTLNQLQDEVNVFKVTTRENENIVGFFGEINPLSNFYPSTFVYDGIHYISSEQFIQSSKAKYFGDLDTYNLIMGCATSLECKNLSCQIRNVNMDKWDKVAGNICHPGIRAKFLQNPVALDTLLKKTGHKQIVECTSDRLWGSGIPLVDLLCLDTSKWISPGIMGQILENIRNEALHSMQPFHHSMQPLLQSFAMSSSTLSQQHQTVPQTLCHPPTSQTPTTCVATTCEMNKEQPINTVSTTQNTTMSTCIGSDCTSTSTTPVSDTTASDTDTGEPQTKQPDAVSDCITETVSVEELTPI